ncbi:unnamed protein product [Meloidogyne enterolobii]|uniref:Uncharacterized protein n=1 Tax=Meloidogyne enterolobii TaxID=390850 RepID=A0ACB0YPN4_MELEN
MAIVELIEEVKNEREELKEMDDEEFKKRREESIINEAKLKNEKELKKDLKWIKSERQRLYQEECIELNNKYRGAEIENRMSKISNGLSHIKYRSDIKLEEDMKKTSNEKKNLLEEKIEKIKIESNKLFEKGPLNLEKERVKMLEKYDDFIIELKERW